MFDTPCKGCKTKDNVTVQIDVNTTFRIMGDIKQQEDPNLVCTFVHQVTARGLQQQLRDATDEAVRMLARSMKHQEVSVQTVNSVSCNGSCFVGLLISCRYDSCFFFSS
jgi:regulator of protease activity HflC (stomatin/prohibitin superfamily)